MQSWHVFQAKDNIPENRWEICLDIFELNGQVVDHTCMEVQDLAHYWIE